MRDVLIPLSSETVAKLGLECQFTNRTLGEPTADLIIAALAHDLINKELNGSKE